MTQVFKLCPLGEYPTTMVTPAQIRGRQEIQIHQRGSFYSEPPTLENGGDRDVISMSREQAIAVAKQILEFTGE